jgi:hypothetical protein
LFFSKKYPPHHVQECPLLHWESIPTCHDAAGFNDVGFKKGLVANGSKRRFWGSLEDLRGSK